MLERCAAHIIARSDAQTRTLEQIANLSGFQHIENVISRRQFHEAKIPTKLNFFLAHYAVGAGPLSAIVRSVRASSDNEVRFAPVILFAPDMEFVAYLDLIRLGFDDIITLPEKQHMLISRLSNQVDKEQVYFETKDYFGPDRRRMELEPPAGVKRSATPHSHKMVEFVRNATIGTRIIRSVLRLPLQESHQHGDHRSHDHLGHWPTKHAS